jgi:prephenate dehydratase
VPSPVAPGAGAPGRIAFLGPEGTFCEQALLTQDDLNGAELVPYETIPDAIAATTSGAVDLGFVPIENSIEGTVNVTIDVLAFEAELQIQREVVLPIQMGLLAAPGVGLDDVRRVVSFPVASAQCRGFLARELPNVVVEASNSTAEAAQILGKSKDPHTAAIGPLLSGELYGLEVLASDIEDHPENATRFVALASEGIPAPTGHDKTSIVVFQRTNAPGSLLAILQEFAARGIDLNKLESRPTKKGLGEYCFMLDMDGHIGDEIVADCLRELRLSKADVKLLGSYPAAGDQAPRFRREAEAAWQEADAWIQGLRSQIR